MKEEGSLYKPILVMIQGDLYIESCVRVRGGREGREESGARERTSRAGQDQGQLS